LKTKEKTNKNKMNYYRNVNKGGSDWILSDIRVHVDKIIMKADTSEDDNKLAETIENVPTMQTIVNGFASALFQEYDQKKDFNLAFERIVKKVAEANYLGDNEDEVLAYATLLAIKKFTKVVCESIEAHRIVLFIERPDVENTIQLPNGNVVPVRQPLFDMRISVRFIKGDDGIETMEFTLPVKGENDRNKYSFACKLSDSFVRQMIEMFTNDNDNFPVYC